MNEFENRRVSFIVTCEHASADLPECCQRLFGNLSDIYESHRIHDLGAGEVASEIADRLSCEAHFGSISRLAIDLNRSIGNPSQFSTETNQADERLKAKLIQEYFLPFRSKVIEAIQDEIANGSFVLHLSIHSFTKVFQGIRRAVDLGVLYDDERSPENRISKRWLKSLRSVLPESCVKANEPYLGIEDGHTTALRKMFDPEDYAGIEIELSQEIDLVTDAEIWAKILSKTLLKVLASE